MTRSIRSQIFLLAIMATLLSSHNIYAQKEKPDINKPTLYKVTKATAELVHKMASEPTPFEIAGRLNIPVKTVNEILSISKEPVSLETPIGDEDGHLMDLIEDKEMFSPLDIAIQGDLKEKVDRILCSLPHREEKIIRNRFGIDGNEPCSLNEISQELDVSRERIRQIEVNAIKRLKSMTLQLA